MIYGRQCSARSRTSENSDRLHRFVSCQHHGSYSKSSTQALCDPVARQVQTPIDIHASPFRMETPVRRRHHNCARYNKEIPRDKFAWGRPTHGLQ
jgi:hypothetical protein